MRGEPAANVGRKKHGSTTRLTTLGNAPAASAPFADQPKNAANVESRNHETSTRQTATGAAMAAGVKPARQPSARSLWCKSHAVCVDWKSPRIISLATTGSAASDDVQLANLQRDLRASAARVQSRADDNGRGRLRMHPLRKLLESWASKRLEAQAADHASKVVRLSSPKPSRE